ncbi:MAG: GNAT family N-acetyltransferase [Acidimicrobiales bacterium]
MPEVPPTPGRPPGPLSDGVVTARPFTPDDVDEVTEACQDPEIARWTSSIPWPYRTEHARDWIATHPREWASGRSAPFAVVEAASGRLLGSTGLHDIDRPRAEAKIGYWVAAWARGRGVATRSVRLVTRWAFSELGLVYLDLLTKVGNVASERVAARAGYRCAGVVTGVPGALEPTTRFDARRWTITADGREPLGWAPERPGRP